ncbi:MAG: MFS transporter [Verrucomicrobia bacterium]|nr:MFS transporter [Verrucomicrobiota bacterium]
MSVTGSRPAGLSLQDHRRCIVAITGGSIGNLVEWYDFYVYSFGALYFASAFFPAQDRTSELLAAAGVFAAGFFMRPLGGWLFGRLADTRGRRAALLLSVVLMCGGSLVIAFTPSYASIGVAAPLILLLARLAQGLSIGGEYGTSATYMSEMALAGHRGFYSSFQYVTLIGGQLLALFVMVSLQTVISPSGMSKWGWRIPFVIGAAAALVAVMLRRSLAESTTAEVRQSRGAGSLTALWPHWRSLLIVLGLTAGGSLTFYTFTTYMQKYLVNTAGMKTQAASVVMAGALVVYMLVQPVFGALSDKIGRRASLRGFGVLSLLFTAPLLNALGAVTNPVWAFVLVTAALLIASLYSSCGALVKAELFPTEIRALGVGLSYAVANALFGGTAEYAALQLKSWGVERYFPWYVTVLCAAALAAALWMPDTRQEGYLEGKGTV